MPPHLVRRGCVPPRSQATGAGDRPICLNQSQRAFQVKDEGPRLCKKWLPGELSPCRRGAFPYKADGPAASDRAPSARGASSAATALLISTAAAAPPRAGAPNDSKRMTLCPS